VPSPKIRSARIAQAIGVTPTEELVDAGDDDVGRARIDIAVGSKPMKPASPAIRYGG
jgi:hypothetical protein